MATLKLGMQQGLQGQTRAQRQGDFKDNSNIDLGNCVVLCFTCTPIYLWRKVIFFVLFCNYEIHQTGMLQIMFLVSLESLNKEGCMGLIPWCLDLRSKRSWILNDFFTENNGSWKFQKNWNVPLVLLEISWWAQFNGIYLVRFGFRMWEILIFKWFLPLKIQINPKNQVLEGKISWRCVNTWVNGTDHTSVTWKRTFGCRQKYDKCTQAHETL